MLMRFNQEAEVAVITEVRGQENLWRLAVHLPEHNKQQKKQNFVQMVKNLWLKNNYKINYVTNNWSEKYFMMTDQDIFMP